MAEEKIVPSYGSIATIKENFLEIAKGYFNLDNINNYQTGVFGYIIELLSNVTEDSFNSINISRREFYPNTAMYKESLYDMAVVQNIGIPIATPSTCKAILIVKENEIIANGTASNGIQTYVIDNSALLMADDVPFMLDFPIIILSKRIGNKWNHTSHYDVSVSNSLAQTGNRYVMNAVTTQNGERLILLSVTLRQVRLERINELIIRDSVVDTITMDFQYDGNLANFEVYYKEGDTITQLKKIMKNGGISQQPFCNYELTVDGLRLTFPKNAYFTPAYNSEIILDIYTSLGEEGNFDKYEGSLTALIRSEKYPYNDTMTLTGKINGPAVGGKNIPDDDEFRSQILHAYSTNNTITTANDLQIYFDSVTLNSNNKTKILFRKRRDDVAYRTFGAYTLLKDLAGNVVPTNTLSIKIKRSDIAPESDPNANRLIIKPGTIFEYENNPPGQIAYGGKLSDVLLTDDLVTLEKEKFLFTNPFLISLSINPNIIGFYMNSFNTSRASEYIYINDNSSMQFIASPLYIERNALLGENFYKISMKLKPASDLDPETIMSYPDPGADDYVIKAKRNGRVASITYNETQELVATIRYDNGVEETIICNNGAKINEPVNELEPTFTYSIGYKLNFNVGDDFLLGDTIAVKMITDFGKLRLCADIKGYLMNNNMYVPLFIEEYNEETDGYTFVGYISTDDILTPDGKINLQSGVMNSDGTPNNNVSIPMNKVYIDMHAFYKNDEINYSHKYSDYMYFKGYTLVNTYSQNNNDASEMISFIQQIDFIRSIMTYSPISSPEHPNDFMINISEMPVSRASWTKNPDNYNYLIKNIYQTYEILYDTYFLLENNFGICLAFFNTYGKSRFYRVGIKDDLEILDNVNCRFRFGVFLTSLNSPDAFLAKFRTFVKEEIETVNYQISNDAKSIYIMNLISKITAEFPEIGYTEYYGFNSYDYSAQKIDNIDDSDMTMTEIQTYIPEFINISTIQDGNTVRPDIDVLLLEE